MTRHRFRTGIALAVFLSVALAGTVVAGQQPGDAVVRFAVIGDQGTGDKFQFRIAEQMTRWHDALPYGDVLTLGDNFYGPVLLWWRHGSKRYFKQKFDEPYAELLRRGVRFHLSLGNHDVRTRNGRDIIEDKKRFHITGAQGYYRFGVRVIGRIMDSASAEAAVRGGLPPILKESERFPLVEFFALNTTRFDRGRKDPEQLAWLLSALELSKAEWKIVYGHHPLYSTGARHGSDKRLRRLVEPFLIGRVQVALAGHDHIYQRFHPQNGVVYFVEGSSGALRKGEARSDPMVAAEEDRLRAFMLWEATATELRFRAINERGEAFDCGRILPDGTVTVVPCSDWPGPEN